MSHQVLARKWRPKNFSQVVGQLHVVKALTHALDNQRLHHAYLFTGTRGVGKTTLARVFAKALNCEQGVSATPCEQCENCVQINQGRFVDLIEVDAASKTKVEDTRELLDNVQYVPTQGRYKIYLIDEVHMLSGHSFNALLKTLEEPPEYVKFLLATTEADKLPITVLSRCLQFHLKALDKQVIAQHLERILEHEQATYETDALLALAAAARGSVRDSLSLLDQALAFCSDGITSTDVHTMLGTVEHKHIEQLLHALITKDAQTMLQVSQQLQELGIDYTQTLSALIQALHQLAWWQSFKQLPTDNINFEIQPMAEQVTPEDTQLFYQIALLGLRDMHLAPEPKIGFEMTLLRMLAYYPGPLVHRESTNEVIAKPEPKISNEVMSQPEPEFACTDNIMSESQPPLAEVESEIPSPRVELAPPSVAQVLQPTTLPVEEPIVSASSPNITECDDVTVGEDKLSQPLDLDIKNQWYEVVNKLDLGGVSKTLVQHCIVKNQTEHTLELILADKYKALFNNEQQAMIAQAINSLLGRSWNVLIELGGIEQETPHQRAQAEHQQALSSAIQSVQADENVQQMLNAFDGTLDESSVELL